MALRNVYPHTHPTDRLQTGNGHVEAVSNITYVVQDHVIRTKPIRNYF